MGLQSNLRLIFPKVWPQSFADMVRVYNNLLIDALKVDSITVYGLLVSYNKDYTFPFKYFMDFSINSYKSVNSYKIEVGERCFFHKIFSVVFFIALLGSDFIEY